MPVLTDQAEPKRIDNYGVYLAIRKAMLDLGLEELGGHDEYDGIANEFGNDYYEVQIIIKNNGIVFGKNKG